MRQQAQKKFDALASKDSDGTISRFLWSFGDGTPSVAGAAKQNHKFKNPGTYTVRLTVFDNAGCSTALVWTGQTAYCNGNRAATVTHPVTVKKPKHKKHRQ